ncbi:MAG: site-2 protease family protein [Clostridia bacterium]|nr:site-2 protease family protein [Clostridia bacterium]
MFSYIESLISDPKATIIFFLLALPARVMALSIHEWAHAWTANKCGDPTARMMGRMTLNPAAHLDLVGTIMMAVLGFGWARPVPVNPRNYKNPRRDDILVSLAGITMNLALFLLSYIICAVAVLIALSTLPVNPSSFGDMFLFDYEGSRLFFSSEYALPLDFIIKNAPYMADYVIAPIWGKVAGYIFEMLQYFVEVNICLAVFNLIPIPPLDGSHVLHNALLSRSPYNNPRIRQGAHMVMIILLITPIGGRVLGWLCNGAINGVGSALYALLHMLGLA